MMKTLIAQLLIMTGLSRATAPAAAAPKISYQLRMTQPYTHLFEVTITFEELDNNEQYLDLILPVWRPGRYVIFDFAGGVQEFAAQAGKDNTGATARNRALPWKKMDKTTWRVTLENQRTVTLTYKVYANEFNLRTRGLNDQHAFVNGTAVFMYAEKFRSQPLTLQVFPYGSWHVSTGLDRPSGKNNQFQAPTYDYFVDCPLEIGTQQDIAFEVQGKKIYLSIQGSGNWESGKLIERLQKIVQANFDFWGDLPFEHYNFLVHSMAGGGGGGTEHLNSTIMGINSFGFSEASGYDNFTSLAMHEFFHTWNVKQLRPADLHPYDYKNENYSRLLWVAEGTTSYYTTILMRRAGFTTPGNCLTQFATMIRSDRRRPGRKIQTLEESSYDAWIKFWKAQPDDQNREVDYYDKGAAVSLLLDLDLRQRTQNRASLDDVMHTLYHRFPLSGPGYSVEDFEKTVNEIGGADFHAFFASYVRGLDELDFAKYLAYAGLEAQETPGGDTKPALGIAARDEEGHALIQQVMSGSAAYDAGLNVGDEILALNGFRVRASQLQQRVTDFNAGDKVQLTLFRNDQIRQFEITLRPTEDTEITVKHIDNPSDLQKQIYAAWMGAPWPEPVK